MCLRRAVSLFRWIQSRDEQLTPNPIRSWRVVSQVTLEEDRVLVMKGGNGKRKREEEEEGEGCRYIRLERGAAPRSFTRKFRLPEDADTGGVAARCENGVLTVTVKKQPPPEKKTKSVQVTIA